MAGYLVALVCYGIEFAAGGGIQPTAAEAASAELRAAGRAGGTAVITRTEDRASSRRRTRPRGASGSAGRPSWSPWSRWSANVISIVCRGFAAGRLPLANMYEFTSMICAAATLCWLIVLARTGARQLGLFVMLPVALLAFVAGTVLYTPAGPVVPALNSYWKWIHVTTISLSASVLLVSGAASLMYILRARYERSGWRRRRRGSAGRPASAVARTAGLGRRGRCRARRRWRRATVDAGQLPSLATLDRIAYRTAIVAFPVYTFAIIAGAMWAEVAWGRYWGWDPKETVAFISWVIYACYLHARATTGWRGVRAAWISVLGFATIIFNLFFVNMVVSGLHSYAGLN